jgi:hypothetical protein
MNPNFLRPIQAAWAEIPAGPASAIQGTSRSELGRMEALLPAGHRFPEALETYLSWAGDKAGQMYLGYDFSADMIARYLDMGLRSIQAMVRRNGGTDPLPADLLLLHEDQGERFAYILLSAGHNPPVYTWEEGGSRGLADAVQAAPTLVDWIVLRIEAYRKQLR